MHPNILDVYLLSALNIYLKIIMSEAISPDDSGAAKGKTTPTESAYVHSRVWMCTVLWSHPGDLFNKWASLPDASARANFSMARVGAESRAMMWCVCVCVLGSVAFANKLHSAKAQLVCGDVK